MLTVLTGVRGTWSPGYVVGMSDGVSRHPLAALRGRLGVTATQYLRMVDAQHRELGFGAMATRREKACRWETGMAVPEHSAQVAMASLHGLSAAAVDQYGWPGWLLLVCPDDRAILEANWTLAGTVEALTASARGGPVDRRAFLIASGVSLSTVAASWAGAHPATAAVAGNGRQRLTASMVSGLEQRLDALRRLDDMLGGPDLRRTAVAEYQLLSALANDTCYDDLVGRQLFGTIAEAARICGWLHFDAARHAAAQTYYITALRAAATADRPEIGANVLAFMAIQTYNVGNPQDAVSLVETAQANAADRVTPRLRSLLHDLLGRALSKTGDERACLRELDAAREQYAAGPHDDDPPWLYWLDEGEFEWTAGSSALDLGAPRRALGHFAAARDHYAGRGWCRDEALNLTEMAKAQLRMGEIDEACDTGRCAYEIAARVGSTRVSGAVAGLRIYLDAHRDIPAARDFLDLTS